MLAFGKANPQEIFPIPLSSLLFIAELPHLPLAQVNLFPKVPPLFRPKISLSLVVKLKSPMQT